MDVKNFNLPDKVRLLLRRFQKGARIVLTLENWREVFLNILINYPLTEIRRRDGITIRAPRGLQLWNHYNDIWEHQAYTSKYTIKKSDIVIDIGANIGLFSLFAARLARIVYSFEPSSESFIYLKNNVSSNSFNNIKCFNYALAPHSGEIPFGESEDLTSSSFYRHNNSATSVKSKIVNCVNLQEIFDKNQIDCCDFLKMDCEGCEFEVLFATPPEYLKKIVTISMEFHDSFTEYTHYDLSQYLTQHGFVIEILKIRGTFGVMVGRRTASALISRNGEF
jgi:FkbM family methyltransferase